MFKIEILILGFDKCFIFIFLFTFEDITSCKLLYTFKCIGMKLELVKHALVGKKVCFLI